MTRCLLGIGSNLGDRDAQMDSAEAELRGHRDIDVITASGWEESQPVGGDPEEQSAYLNGAILIETELSARDLLTELLEIERRLGRVRDRRWGPRSLDLDLLLYGEMCIDEPGITVPHPWMAIRKFVLDSAENVAPNMIHPVIGWSLEELAENLQSNPLTIAIVGLKTEAQLLAVRAAIDAAGADAVQLSELLDSADVERSFAEKLRLLPSGSTFEPSSVVSEDEVTIELVWALREATSSRVSAAADSSPKGPRTLVFDYWWWEPCLSPRFDPIDLKDEISPNVQPNLLIELAETASEAIDRFHQGPKLVLPADDLSRLSHDLTAAIQGMR